MKAKNSKNISNSFWLAKSTLTLYYTGGSRGRQVRAPPWPKFLQFHAFGKNNRLAPPPLHWRTPLGNPGSATVLTWSLTRKWEFHFLQMISYLKSWDKSHLKVLVWDPKMIIDYCMEQPVVKTPKWAVTKKKTAYKKTWWTMEKTLNLLDFTQQNGQQHLQLYGPQFMLKEL